MREFQGSILGGYVVVLGGTTLFLDTPTTEGDRMLHMRTGLVPLVR